METFPQLLNRLAIEHLDRQTKSYIERLESVAKTARLVIENKANLSELKKVLEESDAA